MALDEKDPRVMPDDHDIRESSLISVQLPGQQHGSQIAALNISLDLDMSARTGQPLLPFFTVARMLSA